MSKEKYAVDQTKVPELLELGIAESEAAAITLIASGKAEGKIKEAYATNGARTGRISCAEENKSNPPKAGK